jgi:hypothetical protein
MDLPEKLVLDRPEVERSPPTPSASQRMNTRCILESRSTSVDVVSPWKMLSVYVEDLPPSTATKSVSPSSLGVADPAVSVPDNSQAPLPIQSGPFAHSRLCCSA